MSRFNRNTIGLLAVSALATTALVMPAAGQAKSYKVTLTSAGKVVGADITGTIKGKPLGKCKLTAKFSIPTQIQKWTCKGGTITNSSTGTTGAANDAKGVWKITKSTGKFKGAKGKGTFAGKISTGVFIYKGTIKY